MILLNVCKIKEALVYSFVQELDKFVYMVKGFVHAILDLVTNNQDLPIYVLINVNQLIFVKVVSVFVMQINA